MNYECLGCEFYNKPYWSIINPCANCSKRFKKVSGKATHYTIHIDNKELYKEIENLQSQLEQKEDNWNKLKEWLEEEIKHLEKSRYVSFNEYGENKLRISKEFLFKMQDIEGGMNE